MLRVYNALMAGSGPLLRSLLRRRGKRGKEDLARLNERMGIAALPRPPGRLVWFHAASVGETQSTLILIDTLLAQDPALEILVTTGTITSAQLLEKRLPGRTRHQYYPLDHPAWVESFLEHWQPDLVLWMESEIWPNMLSALASRKIPAALINARLSPRSFRRWRIARRDIARLLGAFNLCLAQSEEDAAQFRALGAKNVSVIDNLKYGAAPLPCDEHELARLQNLVDGRPLWLFASTHDGEEEMACRLHLHLQKKLPTLLTVIVPRHPDRQKAVQTACEKYGLKICVRGGNHAAPGAQDQIYLVDTLGELGLFYRLAPIACIGRSFSRDGGGGHNPIEAAQLGCAVLHGPNVQNLARIYEEFTTAGAALRLKDETDFQNRLDKLLSDPDGLAALQNKAQSFTGEKGKVRDKIIAALAPLIKKITMDWRECA